MGMGHRFGFKRLDVYQLAVEHFRWTCDVVGRLPKGPWEVVRQAVSASLSIMGNIGEGSGRARKYGEVEQHYRYAQGSTFEAATHLDAFLALKVIDRREYDAAEERLARIAAMLAALMKRQRRQSRTSAKRTRRASEASAGDRPPAKRAHRASRASAGDRPSAERTHRASRASADDRTSTDKATP